MKFRKTNEIVDFLKKTYPQLTTDGVNFFYNNILVCHEGIYKVIFYTPIIGPAYRGITSTMGKEISMPVGEEFIRKKINKFMNSYVYCERMLKLQKQNKLLKELKEDF